MSEPIVSTRINGVDFVALARAVVGKHGINDAVVRISFNVFGAIEAGRFRQVGRTPRFNQDICLTVEIVIWCQRTLSKFE